MSLPPAEALNPVIALNPQNFFELVDACRQVIKVWVRSEADLDDDLVCPFVAIESEADEVGTHGKDRADDEAHFYDFYYPTYLRSREELRLAIAS